MGTTINRLLATVGFAAAFGMSATLVGSPVNAETVTCDIGNMTFGAASAVQNQGFCTTGNPDADFINDLFGPGHVLSHKWEFGKTNDETDFDKITSEGTQQWVKFTDFAPGAAFDVDNLDTWGTFAFEFTNPVPAGSSVILALKQSTATGSFMLDLTNFLPALAGDEVAGNWFVTGSQGSTNPQFQISNASLYVNIIPTPFALPLIASAFGIAFAVRRFGRAKTAA